MRSHARLFAVVVGLALSACVGTVGGTQQQGQPDARPGGTPDAPGAAAINVTGMTMDYFGAVALPSSSYTTDGMTPALSGQSGPDGSFTLANIPPASSFYVSVTGGTNYLATRNDAIRVTDTSVQQNLYAVSKIDCQRQYVSLGITPPTGQALLIGDLRKNNGTPYEGIKATDITLVDANGAPVPGVQGPYFFGPNGDVVSLATIAVSTTYNGSARVAYLSVPPGNWMLKVAYTDGQGNPQTFIVPSMTTADGVTLVSTGHDGGTGQTAGNLTFTKDVYPLLQRAALGGQGCANCHNGTELAGGLAYDGPAGDVYAKIMGTAGVVDKLAPAKSMLLTMPLYENPPDLHPNATWLTMQDPAYMTVMQWISQGAVQ